MAGKILALYCFKGDYLSYWDSLVCHGLACDPSMECMEWYRDNPGYLYVGVYIT